MSISGKAALVTGGGRGIGRAAAIALAREGANVCVTARSSDEIEKVAAEIRAQGVSALAVTCDVADDAACEQAVKACAAELGGLDVLINNAGGNFARGPVAESDPADWRLVVESNLLGTYHMARAALPHMMAAGGGKIINVGSGMGHSARANNAAYNAAKAGVWMFTRCLALEVWPHAIDVNEIVPGPVYTKLTEDFFEPGKAPPLAESERVKTPEECVPLILFLATHPPGGPTGQSFSLARRPIG